jgi:hypothetical protein
MFYTNIIWIYARGIVHLPSLLHFASSKLLILPLFNLLLTSHTYIYSPSWVHFSGVSYMFDEELFDIFKNGLLASAWLSFKPGLYEFHTLMGFIAPNSSIKIYLNNWWPVRNSPLSLSLYRYYDKRLLKEKLNKRLFWIYIQVL